MFPSTTHNKCCIHTIIALLFEIVLAYGLQHISFSIDISRDEDSKHKQCTKLYDGERGLNFELERLHNNNVYNNYYA